MKNAFKIIITTMLFHSFSFAQDAKTNDNISESIAFLVDSIVNSNVSKNKIPGASYVIVMNNQIVDIGSKGYSNIKTQQKVKSNTQFMLGSLSKLLTTVAVLQLYESGKVTFDEDINTYLKAFQLPYKVTLRQLLTHTGGLEESFLDRIKLSFEETSNLEIYLKEHLPEQILEPGQYPAYSNHGMALAGLVVQEVSGMNFNTYIQTRIFGPLEMNNSTFSLEATIKDDLATPYLSDGNKLKATSYEYVETGPSAMLISTSEDMAKFMKFQLQPDKSAILKPETVRLMQKLQFTTHDNLWGRSFGFFERVFRGKRMIEHGGSRNGFYSQLLLIPEDGLGIFIVSNGGKSSFRNEVTFEVLNVIYPKQIRKNKTYDTEINASNYEGVYRSNRRVETDFSKLIMQVSFVEKISVSAKDSKTISLLGAEFQMETEDQFNISNDSLMDFPIAFGRNINGNVDTLLLPGRSDSLKKMKWFENELLGFVTFLVSLIVFIFIVINTALKLRKGKMQFQLIRGSNLFASYRLVFVSMSFVFLALLAILVMIFGDKLQYGVPDIFYLVFTISSLSIPILLVFVLLFFKKWDSLNFLDSVYNSLFILLSMAYCWQLYYWNLIGYHF